MVRGAGLDVVAQQDERCLVDGGAEDEIDVGRPSSPRPLGRHSAGRPHRFPAAIRAGPPEKPGHAFWNSTSAGYATVARVGAAIASYFLSSAFTASFIGPRRRIACR
jgi:hypothetical protein